MPSEDRDTTDKAELQSCFACFDQAWASFEEQLFAELSGIEARARAPLAEATYFVGQLDRIASSYGQDADPNDFMQNPEFVRLHNGLIACISRLNSLANPMSMGRYFEPGLLQKCERVVEDALDQGLRSAEAAGAPFAPASRAVLAWDELCCYLHRTQNSVDQFCPELVRLLAAWESSWARASACVPDQSGRSALSDLVQSLREARATAPALAAMLEELSAELFMVLPRLVWLSFLEDPLRIWPLLAPLVPHRFGEPGSGSGQPRAAWHPDPELATFMDDYRQTRSAMTHAAEAAGIESKDAQAKVRAVLTRSVVAGVGDESACRESRKAFLLRLETWSMELQRHRAHEWNQLSALMMTSLDPHFGGADFPAVTESSW